MSTCIALLRGINVGGHRKVAMAELRAMLTGLGFTNGRWLLQSGNVVFETTNRQTAAIEELLQREAATRLELKTEFFVRTADEWTSIIAGNPFTEAAERDPAHMAVMFFKTALRPADVKALQAAIRGRESVHASGRDAYIVYPDGIGTSKLTNAVIEKAFGTRGTARNWNTVVKLAALAEKKSER